MGESDDGAGVFLVLKALALVATLVLASRSERIRAIVRKRMERRPLGRQGIPIAARISARNPQRAARLPSGPSPARGLRRPCGIGAPARW